MPDTDPRVTKRRVTMINGHPVVVDGRPAIAEERVVDYVRPDFLDAYIADARTRWQIVEVSDEPDAGPAGYHGATTVPAGLGHALAGRTFAATTEED